MSRRSQFDKHSLRIKQNGRCYWCGHPMIIHKHRDGQSPPMNAETVDHVYPIWHPIRQDYKRRQTPSPTVLACRGCNNRRGDKPFDEFAAEMARERGTFLNTAAEILAGPALAERKVIRNNNFIARFRGYDRSQKKSKQRRQR